MTRYDADRLREQVKSLTAKQCWLLVWWLYHEAYCKSCVESGLRYE